MTMKLIQQGHFWAWEAFIGDERQCRSGFWFRSPEEAEAAYKNVTKYLKTA